MTRMMTKRNDVGNRWNSPFLEDFFSEPSIFDRYINGFTPRTNIIETVENLRFAFEVPGMTKDDIKVTITNNVLSVSGKRESIIKSTEDNIIREEIYEGAFERQFTLPETIKTDSIKAECKNGILNIAFEKKEEVKQREINVKIS